MTTAKNGSLPSVSSWVTRFLPAIPRDGGRVLDAACGLGRHSVLAALYGYPVLAVDRDDDFALRASGFPEIEFRKTDLETGSWSLGDELFSGIIVVNYLNRPLFPELVRHLAPGGVLIYQTFTKAHAEANGKPANPDHWLKSGELLTLVSPLTVTAFEEGRAANSFVERIVAVREKDDGEAERFPLAAFP